MKASRKRRPEMPTLFTQARPSLDGILTAAMVMLLRLKPKTRGLSVRGMWYLLPRTARRELARKYPGIFRRQPAGARASERAKLLQSAMRLAFFNPKPQNKDQLTHGRQAIAAGSARGIRCRSVQSPSGRGAASR